MKRAYRPTSLFGKISSGVSDLFGKGKVGNTQLFGKGSVASHFVNSVSSGLGKFGEGVGKLGSEVATISNNPLVQSIAATTPYGGSILSGVGRLGSLASGISNTAHLGSNLANQGGYHGNTGTVVGNILEKAKAVQDSGKQLQFA